MRDDRRWIPEALFLLLVAGLATAVFSLTDADTQVSRLCYHPQSAGGAWPAGRQAPWSLLDHAAPRLAGALTLIGFGLLVFGWTGARRRRSFWTLRGLLILLTLLLGPGLVVNVAGKNFWRRPRPHRTAGLGGHYAYVPPLVPGPHGRSFPCGDASVGFAYGAFYYATRRRHPAAARAALVGAVGLGLLIGIERVVTGAHFVSDVVWGGLLTWAVLMLVYYALLAIPRRESAGSAPPGGDDGRPAAPSGSARARAA
jgi:lipid A 4'-phosphatase